MKRKGMGAGLGKGYKNLVPLDPYIHSLSAKGVKTMQTLYAGKDYNFGLLPNEEKKGIIKEIARKVHEGVGWAVKWEKEHLPNQRAWVRKEYEKAKDLIMRGKDKVKDYVEKKKEDLDDVRDELDTDDDGTQDIELAELEQVNQDIKDQLGTIDLDDSGIPDYIETGALQMEVEPEVEEQGITFPFPTLTPHETFGGKVKRKLGELREKEREFVQKRKETREMLAELSDRTLEEKAVRTQTGLFGGNMYEKELLRRQKRRVELKKEIAQERSKAIKEEKTDSGFDLSFINPLSTFSKKKE